MDEKAKLLISFGEAVASNCVPCFEQISRNAGNDEYVVSAWNEVL